MPKEITFTALDYVGRRIFGVGPNWEEIIRSTKKHGDGMPVEIGQIEYSYNKNGKMIFGRRPIGPQRAARNRCK